MKRRAYYISLLLISLLINSCVEEFNAATTEFEDVIVIEATLTDQVAFQQVLLSRTFKIDETQNQQGKESGANVRIISGSTTYDFSETSPGVYVSNIQFRAELNTDYQLLVTTQSGREYQSEVTQLRSDTFNIENVYAVGEVNQDGVDGVSIYIDSYDPVGNSRYYSFDFQETYQIVAPHWTPDEVYLLHPNPNPRNFILAVRPRTEESRVCYSTINNSNGRLITNTNLLDEDRVSRFLIAFIPNDDIRVSSRYSINVKQYANTEQAYNFYEKLDELSSVGSLLSPVQPGFVAGNIISTNNPNDNPIGFFEVAAVREQRIFFNRLDYTNQPYNSWGNDCTPVHPDDIPEPGFAELMILGEMYVVGYEVQPNSNLVIPLLTTYTSCGDCRVWGSNSRPDFWID